MMLSPTLLTLLLISIFFFSISHSETRTGSIVFSNEKNGYVFVEGIDPNGPAQAIYKESINQTGWSHLEVTTTAGYADKDQAYWAGYVEGTLTFERIWQHYQNIWALDFGGQQPSPDLLNFIQTQAEWIDDNIDAYGQKPDSSDPNSIYWYQVMLIVQQFKGLVDGYNAFSPHPIDYFGLWLLNSDGDLETLLDIYPQNGVPHPKRRRQDGEEEYTDCSALIKLIGNAKKRDSSAEENFQYSDLFTGHTTWRSYAAMLRIYKFYVFQFSSDAMVPGSSVAFSASPGFLSSKDDWYISSSGLVSIETTNSIYDETLYQYVVPQTVLTWIRSILANRLASTSDEWVNWFAKYNSGTYNNQWMVVDYKVFQSLQKENKKATKQTSSGLLSILEQIPGKTEIADVSDVLLQDGYWASYNIPYFQDIYDISGYPAQYEKYGDKYSYSNCSRAQIFRRDQPSVVDIDDMKKMMRYNDFQEDPISEGNPTYTVSSRYDLKTTATSRDAFGGVDSKVTCAGYVPYLAGFAQSGPTHDQQTPFSWSNWTSSVSDQPQHIGHPDTFDFDYEFLVPKYYSPAGGF